MICERNSIKYDRRGRRSARKLRLEIRGTIGLFVEAKNKSVIESVKECIDELLEVGYYLEDGLIEEALRKADEI